MPIAASDLLAHGSLNRPTDDTSTAGGAIDVTDRPEFTQWTATTAAAVVSDAADTRTVTIVGRLATGVSSTEGIVLNGTTQVVGTASWERVLSITLSTTNTANTVTVRQGSGGATRATIGPDELSRTAFFRNSFSDTTTATRYEKFFWLNNHGSLTLTSASVELTADPDSRIRIGVATTVNDSGTVTVRTTAPAGVSFVDDSVSQAVPGNELAASSRIGVWVEQNLPADDSAHNTTFTTELSGQTV